MTRGSDPGRWCNEPGCDTRIIFARRVGTDRFLPLEAADQRPFSDQAVGSVVLVANEVWTPTDLIEHFRVRFEVSEAAARELVSGYPWHRVHLHERADHTTTTSAPTAPQPHGEPR